MNITLQFPVFNPYIESTVEIYVSGCSRKCPGCHNPDLVNFDYGEPLNMEELLSYLNTRENLFQNISITGGDLLCQEPEEALLFISQLSIIFPNKRLWLFTGEDQEKVPDWVWILFDVVKVGSFKKELYNEANSFPITSNQKVLYKGKDY